jgi:Ca-activated chloride channel homolog
LKVHCKILVVALFGVAMLNAVGHSQEEPDVVKVDSSIVVMNATVRDAKNKPVSGLTQKDFKIFEDGVPQPIVLFEAQDSPFAAVILIDTSGSMSERISIARSAAINFLDGLRADDVAAIYRFDSKVDLVQEFSNSRDVADKIFDLKARGMTVLYDAIQMAAKELKTRTEQRKAVIVISDGADTMSGASADKTLKSALADGITIYTIDMSTLGENFAARRQNQGVLRNFAEKTGGVFISTEDGIALRDALKNIVNEMRNQYTIAFEPADSKRDGKWHDLELRVAKPDLVIRTRKGYHAPKGQH